MKSKQTIALIVVLVVIAGTVILLSTGGSAPVGAFEDAGGPTLAPGDNAPTDGALADIVSAEVSGEGQEIVFQATLAEEIPNRIEEGSLDLRWDLAIDGQDTWIVAVDFDLGPVATVSSNVEGNNYLATTSTETFPGGVEVSGDTVTVRLLADEVPEFPDEFTWVLQSRLDADPGDAASGTMEDRVPDVGSGEFPI